MEKLERAGKEQTVIGVRVKLFSIPPAHRRTYPEQSRRGHEALPQAPQEWRPRKAARGHLSSVPYNGTLRGVLERKMEQLKEVEEFLAEGLELGLPKFAEELKKDIGALRRKLGDGE